MKQVAKFVDDRQDKESSAKTAAEKDFTFKSNDDNKAKSSFEHFDQTSRSTSSFSQHSKHSDNNESFSSTSSHEAIQRVSATGKLVLRSRIIWLRLLLSARLATYSYVIY